MAPELIKRDKYNEKVDTWSIGIITYMLLSGRAPFSGSTKEKMQHSILNKEIDLTKQYFKNVSPEAKDFIMMACTKDINQRYSALQLLEHPWIKNTMAK